MEYVVLTDPKDQFKEGEIIDRSIVEGLIGRGGTALPYQSSALEVGNAAWVRRCYGQGKSGQIDLPFALHLPGGRSRFHWVASLLPEDLSVTLTGTLHVVSVLQHRGFTRCHYTPEKLSHQLNTLPKSPSGWRLIGSGIAHVETEGVVSFAMKGNITGARVQWIGASVVSL